MKRKQEEKEERKDEMWYNEAVEIQIKYEIIFVSHDLLLWKWRSRNCDAQANNEIAPFPPPRLRRRFYITVQAKERSDQTEIRWNQSMETQFLAHLTPKIWQLTTETDR